MKIEKYTKDKNNKYKVLIDGITYTLYDDVIIKHSLLLNKSITESELNSILTENERLTSYYDSIKYINKKMRSKKEIYEYLNKKNVSSKIIKETIKKLVDNNFLNDDIFLKCYVNDQINLTNNGINKIRKSLIKLGIDESAIDEYLNTIDKQIFLDKIDKYIDKKISVNKNSSSYMLKNKIVLDLVNLGYDKEDVLTILNTKTISEIDARNREYEKIKKSLEKKYSGDVLEYKIKEKLYRKGFRNDEI